MFKRFLEALRGLWNRLRGRKKPKPVHRPNDYSPVLTITVFFD